MSQIQVFPECHPETVHNKQAETSELRHALKGEKQRVISTVRRKGQSPSLAQDSGEGLQVVRQVASFRDHQDRRNPASWFRARADQQVL